MRWRSFGDDNKTPLSKCVDCGMPNDGAAAASGDAKPRPDDFSICFYCGHYAVFDQDLRLREPTQAEIEKMVFDPRVLDMKRQRKRELRPDEKFFEFLVHLTKARTK